MPDNTFVAETKTDKPVQQNQISGFVTDGSGQPLPGASVIEKGTTNGVQTDFDGGFSIKTSKQGATLIVSYIGFVTKEVAANNQTKITIVLTEDISQLDEVVVVGFGSQKASSVVSSVAQVTSAELKIDQRPVTSGYSALIGAVPGLIMSNNNGSPGSTPNISVRGTSTLNDSEMLIIIDNFEGSLSDIDPQTIESVSVLKDASAVSIYGARGANGVLLVTTKKTGKDKKMTVNYNFNTAMQAKPKMPTTLNAIDYMNFQNSIVAGTWDQTFLDLATSGFYPDTNWADELYESNTMQQSHNLSLTGGSQNSGYLMSASYLTQEGLAIGDDKYERLNLRLKIDTDVTDWLTVGANALISNTFDKSVTTITGVGLRGLPFYPVAIDGIYVSSNGNQIGNAVGDAASGSYNTTDTDRINLQLYAKLNLFNCEFSLKKFTKS